MLKFLFYLENSLSSWETCKLKNNLKSHWEFIPRMSSTVIYDGCNSTEAWTSLAFPSSVTVLAERKRKTHYILQFILKVLQNSHTRGNKEHQFSGSHLQPQQKPATPTADAPLRLKASITGFAVSIPFACTFNSKCENQTKCVTIYKIKSHFLFIWHNIWFTNQKPFRLQKPNI